MDTGVNYQPIPDFDGYLCGDDGSIWSCRTNTHDGRVQSKKWKRVHGSSQHAGHVRVRLTKSGVRVREQLHRVVLLTFVGPCPDGMEACHNDGDPANNVLPNLRWDTHAENMADKIRHGTVSAGESHHNAKLSDAQVAAMRAEYVPGENGCKRLAKKYGISVSNVKRITQGKSRRM